MKLSIITCTYNSEKYLQECFDSVVFQNLNSDVYEQIFVDWFSTDSTIDILQEYQKNNPKKNITITQRIARGIYNAMNEWIKLSQWEYLLFLNSDDYLEKDILKEYLLWIT